MPKQGGISALLPPSPDFPVNGPKAAIASKLDAHLSHSPLDCGLLQAWQASPAAAQFGDKMTETLVTRLCSCRPACAGSLVSSHSLYRPSCLASCSNSSCSQCLQSASAPAGFFRPVKQAPQRPATAFEADKLKPAPVAGIANRPEPIRQRPKDVVVAWWHDNIADLLNSLDMFSPKGTTVRVISEEKPKVSLRRSRVRTSQMGTYF